MIAKLGCITSMNGQLGRGSGSSPAIHPSANIDYAAYSEHEMLIELVIVLSLLSVPSNTEQRLRNPPIRD